MDKSVAIVKGKARRPINPVDVIVLSLIVLLSARVLSMLAVIHYGVDQVNDEARSNSEIFVKAVVNDRLRQLETTTADYAFGDDPIKHAYLSQDREWIDAHIGHYLTDAFGINDVIILDSQNQPVLAINEGVILDPLLYYSLLTT